MKWTIAIALLMSIHVVSAWQITEIMYNPDGTDADREWVEVYGEVFPSEVKFFEDGGEHDLTLVTGNCSISCVIIIADDATNFLVEYSVGSDVLVYDSSWSSLKNTGETVGLTNGSTITEVTYVDDASSGESLQFVSGVWVADVPTPGEYDFFQVPEFGVVGALLLIGGLGAYRKYFIEKRSS